MNWRRRQLLPGDDAAPLRPNPPDATEALTLMTRYKRSRSQTVVYVVVIAIALLNLTFVEMQGADQIASVIGVHL